MEGSQKNEAVKPKKKCTMCKFILIFAFIVLLLVLTFTFFFRVENPTSNKKFAPVSTEEVTLPSSEEWGSRITDLGQTMSIPQPTPVKEGETSVGVQP